MNVASIFRYSKTLFYLFDEELLAEAAMLMGANSKIKLN